MTFNIGLSGEDCHRRVSRNCRCSKSLTEIDRLQSLSVAEYVGKVTLK